MFLFLCFVCSIVNVYAYLQLFYNSLLVVSYAYDKNTNTTTATTNNMSRRVQRALRVFKHVTGILTKTYIYNIVDACKHRIVQLDAIFRHHHKPQQNKRNQSTGRQFLFSGSGLERQRAKNIHTKTNFYYLGNVHYYLV